MVVIAYTMIVYKLCNCIAYTNRSTRLRGLMMTKFWRPDCEGFWEQIKGNYSIAWHHGIWGHKAVHKKTFWESMKLRNDINHEFPNQAYLKFLISSNMMMMSFKNQYFKKNSATIRFQLHKQLKVTIPNSMTHTTVEHGDSFVNFHQLTNSKSWVDIYSVITRLFSIIFLVCLQSCFT